MRAPAVLLVAIAFSAAAGSAPAAAGRDCFVSPAGDDGNSGRAPDRPFRTLARAAEALRPGDTCWLEGGVYRDGAVLSVSGLPGRAITFAALSGQQPILDGSDVVAGPWRKAEGGVWEAPVSGSVDAVFCDGRLMTEARWPNCTWSENWDPQKKWALTGAGSALGRIECDAAARSGEDFSGGLVYLKLSKGNGCYTRPILAHRPGSPTILWDASGLPSGPPAREWHEDALPERIRKFGFAGNRFFVAAAGALDAPQEWWYDGARGILRFIPPAGTPAGHVISIKRRVSAFSGTGVADLTFRGLEFRGCNLSFTACRRIRVERCRFLYPATLREFPDETTFKRTYRPLELVGDENAFEGCEVAWALDAGLVVEGRGSRVENCVVHDVNLDGRHPGGAITAWGSNTVRRCTAYNFGGVGIYLAGQGPAEADHNHLFNGGLYCVDVSAFYIPTGEHMGGTVVAYNWFHDHHGLGFRVDQFGRNIVFHHNLVWNTIAGCKLEGTVLSGVNNTVLAENPTAPFMVVFDRGADRTEWRVEDNAAFRFVDRDSLRETSNPQYRPLAVRSGSIDHNVAFGSAGGANACFVDPAEFDFRPKPGGPLDHAGVFVAGIDPPSDRRPSIGALDSGGEPWVPGADWLGGDLAVPASARAATELARRLRPPDLAIDRQSERYGEQ